MRLHGKVKPKNDPWGFGEGMVIGIEQDGIDSQMWIKVRHSSGSKYWMKQELDIIHETSRLCAL